MPHPTIHLLKRILCRSFSLTVILTIFFLASGHAQVTTAIIPDSTLPVNSSVNQIDSHFHITAGTRLGANLFHSFDTFHVGTGDTANFVNPGGIANILSRVTGGEVSNIFGTLKSESAANMFFLNPNGVVFGPDAALNVNGSFHVSTSDYIGFGNGPGAGTFSATNPAQDILTVDPPSAFGFLGNNPVGITVEGSALRLPEHKTLSIVGGGIKIVGGGNQMLSTPSGKINLTSVALEGEIPLDLQLFDANGVESLGNINLSNQAVIDTSGEGGGTVVIRGGNLFIDNSVILAETKGTSHGEIVDISLKGTLALENGGTIRSITLGPGNAGDIKIQSGNLNVAVGSQIDSSTSGLGQAGTLTVHADHGITISGTDPFGTVSGVFSNTFGSGKAGPLSIVTPQLLIEGGRILTNSRGSGDAAPITIEVNTLSLVAGGQIDSSTSGPGQAGDLTVHADQGITISGTDPFGTVSGVFSNTFGSGKAGQLFVTTPQLAMDNGRLRTNTNAEGHAAPIDLQVGRLILAGGAQIDSSTFGSGEGANLTVNAQESVSIGGESDSGLLSGLFSNAKGTGNAGDILLVTTPTLIMNGGRIVTNTLGDGNAGKIIVNVEKLDLQGGAQIFSGIGSVEGGRLLGTGGPGKGGDILINARNSIFISGASLNGFSSGLFSTAQIGTGDAGDIQVSTLKLEIMGPGQIAARTHNPSTGDAGHILLQVDHASLASGGNINSNTFGSGEGGLVSLKASKSASFSGAGSGIFSNAFADGTGGTIKVISGEKVSLSNEAMLSANSRGTADAGNIVIEANETIKLDNSFITTEAEKASGGNVKLQANDVIHLIDSNVTSSVQGDTNTVGGDINIDPEFIILQNSHILAKAVAGQGGNISLFADKAVLVDSFSTLDASSALGISGSINIQSPIQNLSSTIAPLPQDPAPVTALYGSRCVGGEKGNFSTFVDSKTDALAPIPGAFLASPLVLFEQQSTKKTGNSQIMLSGESEPEQSWEIPLQWVGTPVIAQQPCDQKNNVVKKSRTDPTTP